MQQGEKHQGTFLPRSCQCCRVCALLLLCSLSHSTMKPKNGLAFKSLINVALAVGNHLGER